MLMIPKHITFDALDRRITLKLGELLFPGIVIAAVVLYYLDTVDLPERSLLYAGPLMYATLVLAIITVIQHGITLGEPTKARADGVGEAKNTQHDDSNKPASDEQVQDESDDGSNSDPYFNRRNATLYVAVTMVYVLVLTSFSSYLTTVIFIGLTSGFLGVVLVTFGERRISRLIPYSVGFSLLIWSIFISWLEVPLI